MIQNRLKNKNCCNLKRLPEVEKKVSEYLETPVKIKVSKNKGTMEILFGSLKDFERIVGRIVGSR